MKDPWFTPRFRKLTAGPKRWPWKNNIEIRNEYKLHFLWNMVVGSIFSVPLGIMVGRRAKRFQGGVPIIHYPQWNIQFLNLDPTYAAKKYFR